MRQLVAHEDAALVLCDVNMPNMDGFEMVESARREGIASAHAFVMVTTEADSDLVRRAKACGAKGWIVKPFKPDALLAAVRRLAGEA